jgi:putative redox protein
MAYSYEIPITITDERRVDTELRGHHIATDQPWEKGGRDSAPTPFDLFLASIGTCAGTTIQAFCAHRDIPASEIKLTQRVELDDNGDVREIELKVHLPPSFPKKYVDVLQRVIEQCPVERSIRAMPAFIVTQATQS